MRLLVLLPIALALAALMTLRWTMADHQPFEDEVLRAALVEEVRLSGDRCPLNAAAVERSETWVVAACAAGGLGWYKAASRYGDASAKVFGVFGQDPDFLAVFDRYGHATVPVVAYFVENGSTQYLLQETVGQGLSRLWNEGRIGVGLAELTPEQYGLIAIHELQARGHEMLSEFEIVDGVAVRRQFTRTLLGAKNILVGGITDLEGVIARGERLPSWSEMGWAAFDTVILVGGAGAAVKALRAARAPVAVAGRGTLRMAQLRTAGRGAAQSLAAVGTAAGVATAIALPYVAITRPDLVAGAAGWVAEQAGLPAWSGVLAIYSVLLGALALLLRFVLAPLVPVVRIAAAGFRLAARRARTA